MNDQPVLSVEGLRVRYPNGGVAVEGATFDLPAGRAVVVVGPNGAGKTSLARAIVGFLSNEGVAVNGNVTLHGTRITRWSPERIARSGICYIPERDKVFRGLTVAENLTIFAGRRRQEEGHEEDLAAAYRLFPQLAERERQLAGLLSGGEQQMLALAGAIVAHPDVLVVDEPCLGLAPVLITEVMEALDELRRELGMSLLLVDQNIHATVGLADRVFTMSAGSIAEETVDALLERVSGRGYAGEGEAS